MSSPYFQNDVVSIYHGDCRSIIPELPTVDHVITDPPYSETTHDGARSNRGYHGKTRKMEIGKTLTFESISYLELRSIFINQLTPKLNRWLISFMDWRHIAQFESQPHADINFVRFGVWVKPNGAPQFTGDRPATGWEGIAIMHKANVKKRWNGGGRNSVFIHNISHQNHRQSDNPTSKPLGLMEEIIGLFTEQNDLILDPFMGGGTTLMAAQLIGRRAIGIEIDERQCEQAAIALSQGVLII